MEQWIADVVGKMHINKITQTQLAEELGVTNDYVWMILNGKKTPINAETRIRVAVEKLISAKKEVK